MGRDKILYQSHNMSCMLQPNTPMAPVNSDNRDELKERMRKASFTFGPSMKNIGKDKTIYETGINHSAQLKGLPSDGKVVQEQMKKVSVKIGEGNLCPNETEANTRFKGIENEN